MTEDFEDAWNHANRRGIVDLYDACPAWLFVCLASKHWVAFNADPWGWQRSEEKETES